MAGTNAVLAKRALVAMLSAAPEVGGAGVRVTYGFPVEPTREFVYCGKATFTHQLMRFQGAGQRVVRDEDLTVEMIVTAILPGSTTEEAEDRTVEIGKTIEEAIALDPKMATLDAAPPGLLLVTIDAGELDQDFTDEEAAGRLIYQVGFRSELT
jgi:hypothetical protein